jgi:hypothetical protein
MAEPIIQAPEPPQSQPRLGRIPAIDERDRRFRMAAPRTDVTRRYWISPGAAWDQGNTSQCVSYASNRWLVTYPVVNKMPMSWSAFYTECQRNDEWPGEEPDYEGTSVRAAFKVLKARGHVTSYGWADEAEMVIRQVLAVGPVVMGTDWTNSMFDPDAEGYIWPKAPIVGGHAWLILGVNRNRLNPDGTKGAVRMLNSWGELWGQKGRAWLTFDALQSLIKGLSRWPGEACTATEIKIAS